MKTNIYVKPHMIYQIDLSKNKLNIVETYGETFKEYKQKIIKSYDLNTIVKIVDKMQKGEINE